MCLLAATGFDCPLNCAELENLHLEFLGRFAKETYCMALFCPQCLFLCECREGWWLNKWFCFIGIIQSYVDDTRTCMINSTSFQCVPCVSLFTLPVAFMRLCIKGSYQMNYCITVTGCVCLYLYALYGSPCDVFICCLQVQDRVIKTAFNENGKTHNKCTHMWCAHPWQTAGGSDSSVWLCSPLAAGL